MRSTTGLGRGTNAPMPTALRLPTFLCLVKFGWDLRRTICVRCTAGSRVTFFQGERRKLHVTDERNSMSTVRRIGAAIGEAAITERAGRTNLQFGVPALLGSVATLSDRFDQSQRS